MRRLFVVAVAVICVALAGSASASGRAGSVCRVPRLKGLTLTIARIRATHAGCRLRVAGGALETAGTETVERQSPGARARASRVTVWLKAAAVRTGAASDGGARPQAPQASPQAPPSPPAEPQEPCIGSAAYVPEITEPLITPGPTELVSGFYFDGGPAVRFSAPGCKRPAPSPGEGTVEVMSASGALVATQTSERGHFVEIPLPPGSYTVTGTFLDATINGVHPRETEHVVIQPGYSTRQDFVLQIS